MSKPHDLIRSSFPKVSVIIPTYQREEVLCEAITRLLEQSYKPDEIIVIDQTSCHKVETRAFLDRAEAEGKIRVTFQGEPSATKARNRGINESKSDVLLFIDDDVLFSDDFVLNHLRNYTLDPDIGLVAGQLRPGTGGIEDCVPTKILAHPLHYILLGKNYSLRLEGVIAAPGGNFSVRRHVAIAVGGFDEQFTGSPLYEDTDFWIRVRNAGYKVVFDPLPWAQDRPMPGGRRAGVFNIEYDGLVCRCYYAWRHLLPTQIAFWQYICHFVLRPFVFCKKYLLRPYLLPYAFARFFNIFMGESRRRAKEGMRTSVLVCR